MMPPHLKQDLEFSGPITGRTRQLRILLLDNDLVSRGVFARPLTESDWIVSRAEGVPEARDLLSRQSFDVIIVDLRPDLLGHEAVCSLRATGVALPLLFVSARSTPEATSRALALGADDVAILPLDIPEISAQVEQLASRGPVARFPRLRVGPLEFDFANRLVRANDCPIAFTDAEFDVLETLATRNGAPVRPENIPSRLKGPGEIRTRRTAADLIDRICHKLTPFGAEKLIVRDRLLGFALCEPVGVSEFYRIEPRPTPTVISGASPAS
jgi:two-component system OmpR family response regulator